ncbi:hypothetical protein A4A49_33159 [Nicotiana attenuata]|uniref:Uncharacterized protein n=1 Tax=Nicotiana attenuata TaxID=49451 RepID=A0A314LFP9_NICAT|nr:hypothetical protein A4A49_33159 [Nicotiana attenuata]
MDVSPSFLCYGHKHANEARSYWLEWKCGTEASKVSPPASANTHESGLLMKDCPADSNAQGNRHADSNLPSLPLRQQWKSLPGAINQSPVTMQVKDSNIMLKNLSQGSLSPQFCYGATQYLQSSVS